MKPTRLARLDLADRVRWLVKEYGSQPKLAAEVGVSVRQVKRWCAGDQTPKEKAARELAAAAEKVTGDPYPFELFTVAEEARQESLKGLGEKLDRLDAKVDRLLELLAQRDG